MIGVGSEIYIRRNGHTLLGVVTATSKEVSYVLMANGQELLRIDNSELKTTGVEYNDFLFANKRQLTLNGKLKGWRNILPREEWWFDDEN